MPADDDLIRSALARCRAIAPDVTPEQWQQLEREVRAAWRGRRCYIARKPRQNRARRTRSSSDMPT